MAGRTPGKRMIGLRVLTPEGLVPSTGALVTRNVFRIIDSMPAFYVVGLLFVMFGRRHLRLGDLAAGTVLAVERAPFLEKLGARAACERGTRDGTRVRAARRGLARRGSNVARRTAPWSTTIAAPRTSSATRAARRDAPVGAPRISRSRLRGSARRDPPPGAPRSGGCCGRCCAIGARGDARHARAPARGDAAVRGRRRDRLLAGVHLSGSHRHVRQTRS